MGRLGEGGGSGGAWLCRQSGIIPDLLDGIEELVWVTAVDGHRLIDANRSFERVCGRGVAQFQAETGQWPEVIHPEDRTRVGDFFR